jgi:hypothetical protein
MVKYKISTIQQVLSHIEDAFDSIHAAVDMLGEFIEVPEQQRPSTIPVYSSLEAFLAAIGSRKDDNGASQQKTEA